MNELVPLGLGVKAFISAASVPHPITGVDSGQYVFTQGSDPQRKHWVRQKSDFRRPERDLKRDSQQRYQLWKLFR